MDLADSWRTLSDSKLDTCLIGWVSSIFLVVASFLAKTRFENNQVQPAYVNCCRHLS